MRNVEVLVLEVCFHGECTVITGYYTVLQLPVADQYMPTVVPSSGLPGAVITFPLSMRTDCASDTLKIFDNNTVITIMVI